MTAELDRILKIKDAHKRAFAIGFQYIFKNQAQMNRSDIASAAGVHPSVITCILRGNEKKFPSLKTQHSISKVLNTNIDNIVSIGNRISSGQPVNFNFEVKPRHSDPEIQNFLDHFSSDLPDPGFNNLSTYEKELIKISRSFENNLEFLQNLFDMAGDLFVSYKARKIKVTLKNSH